MIGKSSLHSSITHVFRLAYFYADVLAALLAAVKAEIGGTAIKAARVVLLSGYCITNHFW